MSSNYKKRLFENLLKTAGVRVNGDKPWDIQIHDERVYARVLSESELGLGEAYMDGWWDCGAVDEFITKILRSDIQEKVKGNLKIALHLAVFRIFNMQRKSREFIIGQRHYDTGNRLFEKMLDRRMNYSCGYWKDAGNLDEAQENKLKLVCEKLYLKPGMKVLDIGCGWGAFGKYAAEKYGVETVGLTVSKKQVELGRELCKGLPVEFRLQSYRDIRDKFDRIVSIGMLEHVGYKNYKTYFKVAHRCLKKDGLFLLNTIGNLISAKNTDMWTHKYIFPNGMTPSAAYLGKAIEGLFVMEDWHNFGAGYDPTLMAWHNNFVSSWDSLRAEYDERFFRMWKYYLLSCAGAFRARINQLWQIVLSKNGVPGGYRSIR